MAAKKKTTAGKKKTTTKKKTSSSTSKKKATTKKKAASKSSTSTAAGKKTSAGGSKKKKAGTVKSSATTSKKKKTTTKKSTTKKKTTSSKAAETVEATPPAEPKKKKPRKPAFDAEFLKSIREELADERRLLVAMMQSEKDQLAHKEMGLADPSDMASGGMESDLSLGLMANEAARLEKIDEAIKRIDEGSYGICVECEKPIPKKRLEFLPFALRCLECEGNRERRARIGSPSDDD